MLNRQRAEKPAETKDEFLRLRSLLLGDEYEAILKERLAESDISRVADVLSEAFRERSAKDNSLAEEISPVIESAIDASIKNNPSRITDVIFPIMGPAVRKAVANALNEMIQSLNHLLQESLTARALTWRFKAWRAGIPYGQYVMLRYIHYRVEQVFLIHRKTGILLQSACAKNVINNDPDLVSAMLTAITDFVHDSFENESDNESLNAIQFGELNLLIESGPAAIVAFAVRGAVNDEIRQRLFELIESVHEKFALPLARFDGDVEILSESQPLLASALIEKKHAAPKKKPWLAIVALLLLAGWLSYYSYFEVKRSQAADQILTQFANQQGYKLLAHQLSGETLTIDILRSPTAIPATQLIANNQSPLFDISINETAAAIDDPHLFLPLLSQHYSLNFTINNTGAGPELVAQGVISADRLASLQADPIVSSLFWQLDHSAVTVLPPISVQTKNRNQFQQLVTQIHEREYYFEVASTALTEASQLDLEHTIIDLKRLIQLQAPANLAILQISIMGFADNQGNRLVNRNLSEQRAQLIASTLNSNGIDNEFLLTWGLGDIDLTQVPVEKQRRVSLKIMYQDNQVVSHDR